MDEAGHPAVIEIRSKTIPFRTTDNIQVMNVAAGGTLYQDIPSQCSTTIRHQSDLSLPRGFIVHDAIVEPGTRLATLVGDGPLPVNSWHHQAANDLGQGLVVTARSADGLNQAGQQNVGGPLAHNCLSISGCISRITNWPIEATVLKF